MSLSKKQWLFLLIIWLIAQMIFLYSSGIVNVGESENISVADQLAAGNWKLDPNYYLYFGHILIVLLFKLAGIPYNWIYAVQLLVALAAFIFFIKLLEKILSHPLSVICAGVLFSICPFFQSWVSFLSTDSIFANLLVISIYLLTDSFQTIKYKRWLIILMIVLPFFRPVGFLFIPVAIFYWITNRPKKYISTTIIFFIYFILLCFFSWYCLTRPNHFFYPYHNSEANIICGYPGDLTKFISEPYDPNKSMLHFFISNPNMTWRLFINRLYKSFWMTRPFYSEKHNLFIALFLIPYYILSIIGAGTILLKKFFLKNTYILFGIFIFVLPMLLFCADWVNRFILPAFVFIFILMAFGIDFFIKKFFSSIKIQE